MKIGIDWDGTVSAAPEVFKDLILLFNTAGHECVIVTWRPQLTNVEGHCELYPDMAKQFNLWGFQIQVICTNGGAKREHFDADIWIEDNPAAVLFSLKSEPRFCENVSDYDNDDLVLVSPGFEAVPVKWAQLKPIGHLLDSPVNFKEVSNA